MAEMQPVPDLEKYVDVQDALARVCGNKAIYVRLLGTFKKSLPMEQLTKEVADGDLEAAARTAHSIKGVAANLSLKAAYAKIVDVEAQLKQGTIDADAIAELQEIMDITVQCTDYVAGTL